MLQRKQSCFANHPVRQNADRLVYNFHHVARFQCRHRGTVAAKPDDIARMKGEVARHPGNVVRNGEDHAAGPVAGNRAPVDSHRDRLIHGVDPGDHARPHGLEAVRVLRAPQGAVAALPGALAYVVSKRIAEHAVQCLFFRDIFCLFPYDSHELTLEFDQPGRIPRNHDVFTAAYQSVRRAIPDVGLPRHLEARTVVPVRPFDVGAVVQAGGVEVAADAGWKSQLHSALMPAVLITRAQRSWSFLRKAANSAGLSATVIAPSCFMRACVSGLASDLPISALPRLMIAGGVPAGASTPTHGAVASKPRNPISSRVGTPGKSAHRRAVP